MVIGHDHFHLQATHFLHFRRPRLHLPSLAQSGVAGRQVARRGLAVARHLDQTDAASSRRVVEIMHLAQRRNVNVVSARHFEDGFVGCKSDFFSVDDGFHGITPP